MKWAKIYVFIQNFRHDALTALAEVMAASVIKQVDIPLASRPIYNAISALLSSVVAGLVPANEQHTNGRKAVGRHKTGHYTVLE